MDAEGDAGCCAAPAPEAGGRAGSGVRRAVGWSLIALSCAVAFAAQVVSVWLWPVAAVVAWLGAYQTVQARGCGFAGEDSCGARRGEEASAPLPAEARATRRWMGAGFLALAAPPAALALAGWAPLWPLAFLGAWFGVSFLVAAATGYPGCPEVGAIPSLVLRREIATRCRPMERMDGARLRSTRS